MDEVEASGYWCHLCAQMVNPVMDMEIQCPFCESGFIEEVVNSRGGGGGGGGDLGSERAFSPWAKVFLGIMDAASGGGGGDGGRRTSRRESESEEDDDDGEAQQQRDESELQTHLESVLQRSRRRTILHLLAGLHAGSTAAADSANPEVEREREQGEGV